MGRFVLWSGNLLGLKSKVLRNARYRCDGEALTMEITFNPGLLGFERRVPPAGRVP
ncbi:MAG: hypothetical protein ABSH35_03590 [Isosphaeraceae bacterium]